MERLLDADLQRFGSDPNAWRVTSQLGGTPGVTDVKFVRIVGDVNLDGRFDSSDLVYVFQAGDGTDRISCFGDGIPEPFIYISESGVTGCGDTGTDTIVIDVPGVDSMGDVRIRKNNLGQTVLRISSTEKIVIVSGLDKSRSLSQFIVFGSAADYLP